jgi:hypothetical protein
VYGVPRTWKGLHRFGEVVGRDEVARLKFNNRGWVRRRGVGRRTHTVNWGERPIPAVLATVHSGLCPAAAETYPKTRSIPMQYSTTTQTDAETHVYRLIDNLDDPTSEEDNLFLCRPVSGTHTTLTEAVAAATRRAVEHANGGHIEVYSVDVSLHNPRGGMTVASVFVWHDLPSADATWKALSGSLT